MVAAFVLAVGLRSGSHGGPLALERAEVRHVLLAPVDRTAALRAPAIRQLRFLAFVGIVAGAIAGQLASPPLRGARPWRGSGTGALAGATLVALGAGVGARRVAALRLPRWAATGLGVVLVGLAVADGLDVIAFSPTEPFGELVLWPLEWSPLGLVPPVVGVGLVAVGRGPARAHVARGRRATIAPGRPAPLRRHAAGPAHRRRPAPPARDGAPAAASVDPGAGPGQPPAPGVHPRPARPAPLAGRPARPARPARR